MDELAHHQHRFRQPQPVAFSPASPAHHRRTGYGRIKDICTPFVKHSIETYTVLPFEDLYLHYDEANGGIGEGASASSGSSDHRRLRPFARLHQLYEPVHGP